MDGDWGGCGVGAGVTRGHGGLAGLVGYLLYEINRLLAHFGWENHVGGSGAG